MKKHRPDVSVYKLGNHILTLILRIWFVVCGWSESKGRPYCVSVTKLNHYGCDFCCLVYLMRFWILLPFFIASQMCVFPQVYGPVCVCVVFFLLLWGCLTEHRIVCLCGCSCELSCQYSLQMSRLKSPECKSLNLSSIPTHEVTHVLFATPLRQVCWEFDTIAVCDRHQLLHWLNSSVAFTLIVYLQSLIINHSNSMCHRLMS